MISKLVTVVILYLISKNILQDVLDLFNQTLDKSHYDIIVVNDASTIKLKKYLSYNDDITLINNNKN